jgi:hypothetical protein
VISGWPGVGGFRQQQWTVPDPDSRNSRFLSLLFDIPGGQYAYDTFWPIDYLAAWGPATFVANWGTVTWMATLPPFAPTSDPKNTASGYKVNIPSGLSYAEIQFGYSRFGTPSQFYCTPRVEACNTSGSPFNFEHETRVAASCASGCTITIPAMAPNTMYYRVRRSNDSTFATGVTNSETQAVAVR